ncbi:hypothetical protein [Aneurinibacillus uraniidurans]|uniref:hypothetical protein n=1 Tax=Aneurinibacillus uraniidurans TaxID=2966586 RepID=UPI00234A302D|nr:hypothetical protein [Aneurinibacillus sp. B1]WCN39366.1 hypothetical protein PO771_08230 [Aneurinibacillus sp. B1]
MDKAFKKQVQVAFEEFAGRKVKDKVVDIAVRHAQRIQETDPSLSTEDCIDQAIMKTIKDGVAF